MAHEVDDHDGKRELTMTNGRPVDADEDDDEEEEEDTATDSE